MDTPRPLSITSLQSRGPVVRWWRAARYLRLESLCGI